MNIASHEEIFLSRFLFCLSFLIFLIFLQCGLINIGLGSSTLALIGFKFISELLSPLFLLYVYATKLCSRSWEIHKIIFTSILFRTKISTKALKSLYLHSKVDLKTSSKTQHSKYSYLKQPTKPATILHSQFVWITMKEGKKRKRKG